MIRIMIKLLLLLSASTLCFDVVAKTKTENTKDVQEVYQLAYIEREPGTDEYEVTMLVSERYIRIDETGEESGFIIYDDKEKVIFRECGCPVYVVCSGHCGGRI